MGCCCRFKGLSRLVSRGNGGLLGAVSSGLRGGIFMSYGGSFVGTAGAGFKGCRAGSKQRSDLMVGGMVGFSGR